MLSVRKAGLALGEVLPEHCRHPALDADFARLFDKIQESRGIAILRGLPVEHRPVEDIATIFWALGTHFGRGVSQSALGDLLGEVRDETPHGEPESAPGYLSRRELSLQVDLAQIVGLMCVRQVRSGGDSQYASGLAVHNEIRAARPELLPVPYRGHRRGEEAPHIYQNAGDRSAIDRQRGRLPTAAKYRAPDAEVKAATPIWRAKGLAADRPLFF